MSMYNEALAAYLRDRYELDENWHVKSADNIDNGALIYGVIAPLITRGPRQGEPNFKKESGHIWKFFMSRAEVREAVYGEKPQPGLDYQNEYCAEYAIALHALLLGEGVEGVSIMVAHGCRFDEESGITANVNIHCAIALPDGSLVDSDGIHPADHLEQRTIIWREVHRDCEIEADLAIFLWGQGLSELFQDLNIPIDASKVAIAARDILKSDHYRKITADDPTQRQISP